MTDRRDDRDDLVRGIALLVAAVGLVSFAPQTSDMGQVAGWGAGAPFPYPVLAEITYRTMHSLAPTVQGIAILNGVLQAAFALGLYAWMRWRGLDARIWIAAPILLLVGENLDAMTAVWIAAGIWEWRKGRYEMAGVLLGLGTAFRISPAVVLLPLAAASGRRGGLRMLLAAGGSWLVVNVPYALVDPDSWWAPYSFAGTRADFRGTIWAALPLHDGMRSSLSVLTVAVLILGVLVAVARRRIAPELGAALAMLAFIVAGKVWQPHYVLWLLPILVFVPRVPMRWLRAVEVASLAYFVVLWRYVEMAHSGPWLWLSAGARLVAVTGLIVMLLRTSNDAGPPAPSSATPSLTSTG